MPAEPARGPGASPRPGPSGLRRLGGPLAVAFSFGLVLAKVAGALLQDELAPLRLEFIPASTLLAGLLACAVRLWLDGAGRLSAELRTAGRAEIAERRGKGGTGDVTGSPGKGKVAGLARHQRRPGPAWTLSPGRTASLVLVVAISLFAALYAGFVERTHYRTSSQEGSAAFITGWWRSGAPECAWKRLSADFYDACFPHRWVIQLAMALCYLATLAGGSALAGLPRAGRRAPPSRRPSYMDFDIRLERGPDGRGGTWRAVAWTSDHFEASTSFSLPAGLLETCQPTLRLDLRGETRGGAQGARDAPEEVGRELFDALFQGEVLAGFRSSVRSATDGLGVRLKLHLNAVPELADLPWEYLFDSHLSGFLARSTRTPVVRYLELPEAVAPLAVAPPLRLLVMIATPVDYQELGHAEEEWQRLSGALAALTGRQQIVIERLFPPTSEALQRRLRTGEPVHVFHFVGHGGFSQELGQGMLVLESADRRGRPIPGRDFADLLKDHRSLRLAVLNACRGARASGEDAFSGAAQSLVERAGVPAVVAMRSEVTDETACLFAESFFQALADLEPVDACVGEARKALVAKGNPEWGTPVLYLRAADGCLFAPLETGEDGRAAG